MGNSYKDILSWPKTPTHERLTTALRTLKELTRSGKAAKMAQAIEQMTSTDRDDIKAMLVVAPN